MTSLTVGFVTDGTFNKAGKAYEKHVQANGKPETHAKAKLLL